MRFDLHIEGSLTYMDVVGCSAAPETIDMDGAPTAPETMERAQITRVPLVLAPAQL